MTILPGEVTQLLRRHTFHRARTVPHYAQQPDAKTKLKEAFDAAKVTCEVEVYSQAQHGWCVPDMPMLGNGQPLYSKRDAERAWAKLLALYKSALS